VVCWDKDKHPEETSCIVTSPSRKTVALAFTGLT